MSVASVAHADGLADEADLHFQIAAEHYRSARFRDALEHFLASNRLVPNRNVVFNIARAYEQLQRFPDAHRYYTEALEAETDAAQRATLEGAIARISPNVTVLRVESDPPGATIYINRRDLGSRGTAPRALAFVPGRYRVLIEREGYEPAQSDEIDGRLGQQQTIRLQLRRIVGTVLVEGENGARIHVDDEQSPPQCTAPCSLELSPGAHTLFFSREGYQTAPRPITVEARGTVRARATLQPLTGSLVVSADEREALVEVDGRSVGFTPVVAPNIPVGTRRVRVSLRGFTPVERQVTVNPNQQTELIELQLSPLREVSAASRVAESLEDAPSSVSILDGRELRAFAYPTIAEALRGVRGVSLSSDGVYVSLGIRGIGQPNDFGKRLLVLSDGNPMNDNLLASSYVGYDGRTDIEDLERIEVVRGPGSLLYGTGALSGVVNLLSRDRDLRNGGSVGVSTYDNGVFRARAQGNLRFGDAFRIWLSASGARSDGRDETLQLREPMPGTPSTVRINRLESFYSAQAATRMWIGPITVQGFFNHRSQVLPMGAYGYVLNDLRNRYEDTRYMLEVRAEPRIGNMVQLFMRAFANAYTFFGSQIYDPAPDVHPNLEDYTGVWLGLEGRAVITPAPNWRITAGAEGQYHPIANIRGASFTGPSRVREEYVQNGDAPYGTGAVYALAEATPVRWFRFSAGVRLDLFTFLTTPAINPRLALIFRPWNGGNIKLMGGSAFRAPSLYERVYNDGGIAQAQATGLVPETAWSGELEVSHRFAENWVALGTGHVNYISRFIDAVSTRLPPNPTLMLPERDGIQYKNLQFDTLTAGGDIELRREWRQGWMLSVMYGYLSARYLPTADPSCGGMMPDSAVCPPTDTRVVNAPEHFASVRAVAPIIQGAMNGAIRLTVEGPRRISQQSSELTTPAVIADLVLSGQVQRFGLRYAVGVYNAFDWRYTNPVPTTYPSATMPQQGRSFMANINVDF